MKNWLIKLLGGQVKWDGAIEEKSVQVTVKIAESEDLLELTRAVERLSRAIEAHTYQIMPGPKFTSAVAFNYITKQPEDEKK